MRALPIALLLAAAPHVAAQQAQKCCGTSNSTFLFGSTAYARHTQMLYLPGDLTGAAAGPITHLYFRYGTTSIAAGNSLGNFEVRLGLTDQTAFPGGNAFFTDLSLVYTAAEFVIPPGATGQWFVFSLQTPFIHNPARTLIVDIQFETSAQQAFGTYGTANNGRKLISPDLASPTGSTTSTTWQDFGFDVNGTTGMSDDADWSAVLWPNPAQGRAWLSWPSGTPAPARLAILDASGREVRAMALPMGARQAEIDLDGLAPGPYLIRWQGKNGGASVRLIKE